MLAPIRAAIDSMFLATAVYSFSDGEGNWISR
jgi:hypothetical protein